jgi:hypothetical protein
MVKEMICPDASSPSEASLLKLYDYAHSEQTRYRDVEWKVPSIVLTFLFGLATALSNVRVIAVIQKSLALRTTISLIAICFCVLVIGFFITTQSGLKRMDSVVRDVEVQLRLSSVIERHFRPAATGSKWQKLRKAFALLVPMIALATLAAGAILTMVWF